MITSRHNTFGCWSICIVLILFLNLSIYCFYDYYVLDIYQKSLIYFGIGLFFIVLTFLIQVASFIKKISIDLTIKEISYKNIITRQRKVYDFSYFDGIIDTYLNHKSPYKTIGFVKDKVVVHYINSYWVSNYDEIREFIKDDFTYLGEYKFGTWQQIRLLLRKPVID